MVFIVMVLPSSFAREIVIDTTVAISIFHGFFSSWIDLGMLVVLKFSDRDLVTEIYVVLGWRFFLIKVLKSVDFYVLLIFFFFS